MIFGWICPISSKDNMRSCIWLSREWGEDIEKLFKDPQEEQRVWLYKPLILNRQRLHINIGLCDVSHQSF